MKNISTQENRQDLRNNTGLLAFLALTAIWLSWTPFRIRNPVDPVFQLWTGNLETVSHLLMLMPLGLAMAAVSRKWLALRQLVFLLTAFALLLELGQAWIQGRSFSADDLGANIIGAMIGILILRYFQDFTPSNAGFWAGTSVYLVLSIWIFATMWNVSSQLKIQNWNPDFPVVQGDEHGGGRAYVGEVRSGYICSGEQYEEMCIPPGARTEERETLAELAESSQRVFLSGTIISESDEQQGPTRIITFSPSGSLRNTTLAQEENHLVFRIRTPLAEANGGAVQYLLPEAIPKGTETRVSATFDRGTVYMESKSPAGHSRSGSHRPDFLFNNLEIIGWDIDRIPELLRGLSGIFGVSLWLMASGYLGSQVIPSKIAPLILPLAVAILWLSLCKVVLDIPIPDSLRLFLLMLVVALGGIWTLFEKQ